MTEKTMSDAGWWNAPAPSETLDFLGLAPTTTRLGAWAHMLERIVEVDATQPETEVDDEIIAVIEHLRVFLTPEMRERLIELKVLAPLAVGELRPRTPEQIKANDDFTQAALDKLFGRTPEQVAEAARRRAFVAALADRAGATSAELKLLRDWNLITFPEELPSNTP